MTRRRIILWDTPYGGMRIRGTDPARAVTVASELIARFTTKAGFQSANLSVHAWPSAPLLAWAQSQPAWTTLPLAQAESGIATPHPALLATMSAYGEPFCHVHESSEGDDDYLRLEWEVSDDDPNFKAWSAAWLQLCVDYHEDPPFESDLPTVTGYFNLHDDAPLTTPDTDEVLPHQAESDRPADFFAGFTGFASVPDGSLLLTACLPFDAANPAFVAFDAALVKTLGKISDTRYRLVTPGGALRKLSWRRKVR